MVPTLFVICGQVGSGKTTTAKLLSDLTGAQVASVDDVVKQLFSDPSFVGVDKPPSAEELSVCYNAFYLIADYLLGVKSSVIIDGAFAKKAQRELVISAAKKHKAKYIVINVTCPEDLLKERAMKRFKAGEGVGYNAHLEIKKIYEPLDISHEVVDTSRDIKEQLIKILGKN